MRKPRRRVSLGTLAMLAFTAAVLACTLAVFAFIRGDGENLHMDAERLVSSVGGMIAARAPAPSAASAQATVLVVSPPPDAVPSGEAPAVEGYTAPPQQNAALPTLTDTPSPAKRTLSLTFGGMIAYESAVVESCLDKNTGKYDFSSVLSGISDAVHADLNIAVLPTLLSTDSAEWGDTAAPAQCLEAIFGAGFDYLILGAENSLENGEEGVFETLNAIAGSGISATGLYRPEDTAQRATAQVNGVKIAILSYNETLSKASRSAVADETARARLITPFSREKAISDVRAARAEGAGIVLVSLHWGALDQTSPTAAQKETAQALCDAGADIIICAHSDATMPVTLLTSADGARQTLVAWSLGTLLSESRDSREVVSSALLHVQLSCDADGGRLSFDGIQYTPTFIWRQEAAKGEFIFRVIRSDAAAPEGMVQRQREVMGRALALIQGVMKKGAALQR